MNFAPSQTVQHRSYPGPRLEPFSQYKIEQLNTMRTSILLSRLARQGRTPSVLSSAFQRLSIAPSTTTVLAPPQQARRHLSQSLLSPLPHPRQTETTTSAIAHSACTHSKSSVTGVKAAVALQQTRGMKVQSSVKKRCEHCKVGAFPGAFQMEHGTRVLILTSDLLLTRLCEGRAASGIADTSTSFARPTRGTSNDRAEETDGWIIDRRDQRGSSVRKIVYDANEAHDVGEQRRP